MSQSYSRCEPRIYIAADNRRNGVVGNTGRKMPSIPKANDILPKTIYRNFIQYFFEVQR